MLLGGLIGAGFILAIMIMMGALKAGATDDREDIEEWIRQHEKRQRQEKGDQYHEK